MLEDSATFLRSDWRCLTEEIKENDAFNVNRRYLKSPAGLMNNQKHFMHVATSARSILQSMTGWLRSADVQVQCLNSFRTSMSHYLSELIVKQATFIYYWWTNAWLLFWILSPNPSLLSHFGCCLFVSSPFLALTDICSPWGQVCRMQGGKGPLNPSHLLRDFW